MGAEAHISYFTRTWTDPMNIAGIEIFKILKRRESLLLFAMWLIPLIYAYGFSSGSDAFIFRGTGDISCLTWIQIMFSMLQQIFIFHVFVVIIAARSLASEIEERSLALYIPRINNRRRVFAAKTTGLIVFVSAVVAGYLAVSVIAYYSLMVRVPKIASGAFWSGERSLNLALYSIEVALGIVFVAVLALFVASRLKALVSVAVTTVSLIVITVLSQLNGSAYVTPWFYLSRLLDVTLGSATPETAVGNIKISLFTADPAMLFGLYCLVTGLWCFGLYFAGSRTLAKRDL